MTVLICGGRDYANWRRVFHVLDYLHRKFRFTKLVHGNAQGLDTLADKWARQHGIPRQAYPADWERHGKAAGPIRNQQMLTEEHPEIVVVFPGGRGTADMRDRAQLVPGVTVVHEWSIP